MSGFNYNGSKKRVFTWGDGVSSWDDHVSGEKGTDLKCQAQLIALAERLATVGGLRSPDQFNNEGNGIYAIKANCGLRAYGWFGTYEDFGPSFVIGWVVHKKRQKLDPSDRKTTLEQKKKFESKHK